MEVAAVSWCAIVLSYLIPFRNLLDGKEEEEEEEEDTFTGQKENTSTATVWTRPRNTRIHTHTRTTRGHGSTDGAQLKPHRIKKTLHHENVKMLHVTKQEPCLNVNANVYSAGVESESGFNSNVSLPVVKLVILCDG